jgi:hypothetical protein
MRIPAGAAVDVPAGAVALGRPGAAVSLPAGRSASAGGRRP